MEIINRNCDCRFPLIVTPAGSCPPLRRTDEAGVLAWIEQIMELGHTRHVHYAPSALRFFAAKSFERDSSEYQQVSQIIGERFGLEFKVRPKSEIELEKQEVEKPKIQTLGKISPDLLRASGEAMDV